MKLRKLTGMIEKLSRTILNLSGLRVHLVKERVQVCLYVRDAKAIQEVGI